MVMREKATVFGNPFIGIYGRTNDSLTLIGKTLPDKFERYLERFGTSVMRLTLGDSDLIGIYSAANNRGIVVSATATDEELAELRRIAGDGMAVERLESKFTAVGNNIATNDRGTIINPHLPADDIRRITDALDTEVERLTIAGYATVGAALLATGNGFVAHPGAAPAEISRISSILKVDGGVGTANGGVPFVPLAVIANRRSFIGGELTTGYELHRLAECLGQI